MAAETKIVEILGDANLSREEAIEIALEITVAKLPTDQRPNLETVKTFRLHEGPIVTKVVHFWDIRDSSTGEVKSSTFKFQSLRRTNERGWELEHHHSFSPGDENQPDPGENPYRFLSSMNSLKDVGGYIVLDYEGIDAKRLSEALRIVSSAGHQDGFLPKLFEWIHDDPQAHERLTQLSADDRLRSQSLFAAINYGRYREALARFKEMVEENYPERCFQKFLKEHYWLFGSEYCELLETRDLVLRQQLDFPLRRTVDDYFEVIEIKTPLDGKSGFTIDRSHNTYFPGRDVLQGTSQVLKYLASLETHRNDILVENDIDVTRVRGKLIVGRDGSDEEMRARKLYNDNSRLVEVISFDGLANLGQQILDIMVEQDQKLREMHSPNESIDQFDPSDIQF